MKKKGILLALLTLQSVVLPLKTIAQEQFKEPKEFHSLSKLSLDSLVELSKTHRYSDPQRSRKYAETILKRGLENSHQKDLAYGYHQLGLLEDILGNHKKAIVQFNKGIAITGSIKDSLLLTDLYLVRGNANLYLKNYNDVLSDYEKALTIAKRLKNQQYIIVSNANIAYLKKEAGLITEAIEIERKNLRLAENVEFGNKTFAVNLVMNLGESFLKLGSNDSAIFYNRIALSKSIIINNIEGTAHIHKNIGIAYHNKKDYNRALRNFDEAITIITPFENDLILAELFYLKAQTLSLIEQKEDAILWLKKAEATLNAYNKSDDISILLIDIYKLFAELYKTIDYSESVKYYDKYVTIDQQRDHDKIQLIKDLNTEKHKQVLLNTHSEAKGLTTKSVYILLGICIVLVVAFFLAPYDKIKSYINPKKGRNGGLRIDDQKTKSIVADLKKLEKKHSFLNPNFSLVNAAKEIKTNPTYLSYIINQYKNQKFQDYVNDLRINYAIERLKKDSKFRSYSVQSIANEVGYKSPNSFTKHFKNRTGDYPSLFISKLKHS